MQLVILLSQIRVNSMAIVRMTSFNATESLSQRPEFSLAADASTTTLKQVFITFYVIIPFLRNCVYC